MEPETTWVNSLCAGPEDISFRLSNPLVLIHFGKPACFGVYLPLHNNAECVGMLSNLGWADKTSRYLVDNNEAGFRVARFQARYQGVVWLRHSRSLIATSGARTSSRIEAGFEKLIAADKPGVDLHYICTSRLLSGELCERPSGPSDTSGFAKHVSALIGVRVVVVRFEDWLKM